MSSDTNDYIRYEALYIQRMTENIKTIRKDHRERVLKLLELPGVDVVELLEILDMTKEKVEE